MSEQLDSNEACKREVTPKIKVMSNACKEGETVLTCKVNLMRGFMKPCFASFNTVGKIDHTAYKKPGDQLDPSDKRK